MKYMWFFGVFSITHRANPHAALQGEHDEDLAAGRKEELGHAPALRRGISGGPHAPAKSMWFFGVFSVTHVAKPHAVQQDEHAEDLTSTVGR